VDPDLALAVAVVIDDQPGRRGKRQIAGLACGLKR